MFVQDRRILTFIDLEEKIRYRILGTLSLIVLAIKLTMRSKCALIHRKKQAPMLVGG